LDNHNCGQANRERFQRAICFRCLTEFGFSYIAAVETNKFTFRLASIVVTFSHMQLALSQMRGDGLQDIAIVRRRHAAVAATFIYIISTGREHPRRMRFARRRWIFSTLSVYRMDNFVACIGFRRRRSNNLPMLLVSTDSAQGVVVMLQL
jgi:hypothetical protein